MESSILDPIDKRCITCTNVPLELLEKLNAKKYFRKFGKIVRVLLRPKSKSCVIEYETEEGAETAVAEAGQYNGQFFTVVKTIKSPKRRIKKDLDPDWLPSPEVQAELDAMSATGSKVNYSLRPEGMVVDQVMPPSPLKRKQRKLKGNWKSVRGKTTLNLNDTPSTSILPAEQMELLNALKQPAFTAEEKYRVLEARDKLMRLRNKKQSDLKKAKHIVGTCLDMCPEKERLMRETQHQVAVYELDSNGRGMNSSFAIKQYSRSSADQEVPLPHELRPVSVLQLTMGYLMHKIMDLCDYPEINLGEWYHFLWDRTRGIRKDITQQELCCQGSVQLVEQCARFHIHCSARLVAEDLSVFDQKINTENLTKCLQTLKYMYHDLEVKHEVCQNEAEFRAYIILLNLNDGNFMWEVQQLKPEIQKSPQVKFALSVYSALDKNNYVKFFKLVCSTTYLNACILLRYFIQVRTRALETILKSSSPRMPCTQFPLSELHNILAFEGLASTIDFFEYYGLCMNENKTHVILDRKMFSHPTLPYALDRAMKVIESKRTCSVGEVVCGEALPPKHFESYVPHNSFNVDGYINVSETFPDIDVMLLQKTVPVKDLKVTEEVIAQQKPDFYQKTIPQTAKSNLNIFKNNQILDSRSNSPLLGLDSVDKGTTNLNPDSVQPFWVKTQQLSSNTAMKPETISIFGQPHQKQNYDFKPIGESNNKKSIFGGTLPKLHNSIFGEPGSAKNSSPNIGIFGGFAQKTAKSIFGGVGKVSSKEIPSSTGYLYGTNESESRSSETETNPSKQPTPIGGFYYKLIMPQGSGSVFKKPLEIQSAETLRKAPNDQMLMLKVLEQEKLRKQEQARLEEFKREAEEKERQQREKLREEENKRKEEERLRLLSKKIEEEKQKAEKLRIERERMEQQEKMEKNKKKQEAKRMAEIARQKELERLERLRKEEENKRFAIQKQKELEEKMMKQRLKEISENIRKQKVLKIFQLWRRNIASNKRKRKAMDQWPVWITSNTVRDEASELHMNSQEETLNYMKRYRAGSAIDIKIENVKVFERIDMFHLTYNILLQRYAELEIRLQNDIFWKVDVSLPEFNEMQKGLTRLQESMLNLFSWEENNNSCHFIKQIKHSTKRITYCVTKNETQDMKSTNGFLFVGDTLNELLLTRINRVIKTLDKNISIPVAIIIQKDCDYDNSEFLKLTESECVSNIKILNGIDLSDMVKKALTFLAVNVQKPPPLELDTLKSFLYKNLATEIWDHMISFMKWNHPYKVCLTNPKIVFNLYNEAISRLSAIVFNEDNYKYQEFSHLFSKYLSNEIPDFLPCNYKYFPCFWKDRNYVCIVRNILESLKLPPFETKWPPKDELDLEKIIFDFCTVYFKQPEKTFYIIMADILKNFDPTLDFNKIRNFEWTEVMKTFAREKLKEIDFSLPDVYASQTIFDQLFVVYNSNDLLKYMQDAWFYLSNPHIKKEINVSKQIYEIKRKDAVLNVSYEVDVDEKLQRLTNYCVENDNKVLKAKSDLRQFEILMMDLEKSMAIQKKISKKFDETLKLVLENK